VSDELSKRRELSVCVFRRRLLCASESLRRREAADEADVQSLLVETRRGSTDDLVPEPPFDDSVSPYHRVIRESRIAD
jgi:hypothetical protein